MTGISYFISSPNGTLISNVALIGLGITDKITYKNDYYFIYTDIS